jgi:hypothetical protein
MATVNHPTKKAIGDATRKRYGFALQAIVKNCGCFIADITPTIMLNYVMDKAVGKDGKPINNNLKRVYLSALMWDAKTPEETALYREAFDKIRVLATEETNSQTLSTARAENYADWEDVLKGAELAKGQYESGNMTLNDYTIVCLYTLQNPVRADYGDMRVVKNLNMCSPNKNYLVVDLDDLDNSWFYFRDYKTCSAYGEVKIKAHRTIVDLIIEKKRTMFHNKLDVISQNRNSLTKRIPLIFKALLGKPMTVSLLRHSFITWYLKNNPDASIKDKTEVARTMLHSRFIQEAYRILPPPASVDEDETPSPPPESETDEVGPADYIAYP